MGDTNFAAYLINDLSESDNFVNVDFDTLKRIYVDFYASKDVSVDQVSSNKLSRIITQSLSMYYDLKGVPFSNVIQSTTFRKHNQLQNGKSFDFSGVLCGEKVVFRKASQNIELFLDQTVKHAPIIFQKMDNLRRNLGKDEFSRLCKKLAVK